MTLHEHKQTKENTDGRIKPECNMPDCFIDNAHAATFRPIQQTGNDRHRDCGITDRNVLLYSTQTKMTMIPKTVRHHEN